MAEMIDLPEESHCAAASSTFGKGTKSAFSEWLRAGKRLKIMMKKAITIFSVCMATAAGFVFAGGPHSLQAAAPKQNSFQWHKATAPLMTRWAAKISPATAWTHYPRPQMRRTRWKNLNGLWQYSITPHKAVNPGAAAGLILVPYPFQSALSGVMRPISPAEAVWYSRDFTIPAAWAEQSIVLHIDRSAWRTDVFMNGKKVAVHQGSYTGFRVNITPFLKKQGPQHLRIKVWNPVGLKIEPRGKQVLQPHGMFFTACTGIWSTVWLEPVPADYLRHLVITPDLPDNAVVVKAVVSDKSIPSLVSVRVFDGSRLVGTASGSADSGLRIAIPHSIKWSPSHPFLYHLSVQLSIGGRLEDKVRSYFGMRSISLVRGKDGRMRIALNGKPLFERGALYQGYWPDGLYTPPDDAAMRFDIRTAKAMGFNLLRVHQIVEPQRFYYYADRMGILIWQDMPAAWPPNHPMSVQAIHREVYNSRHWWPANGPQTRQQKKEYHAELGALIRHYRNHPSIIVWTPFNEGWGQHDTAAIVAYIHHLDPSRLIDDASGWFDRGVGDVIETHHYPQPRSAVATSTRAATSGEFGGIFLALPGHYWPGNNARIRRGVRRRYLLALYRRYWRQVYKLRKTRDMSGAVYTELMDQEQEACGLMTFDRKVIKFPIRLIRAATLGLPAKSSTK